MSQIYYSLKNSLYGIFATIFRLVASIFSKNFRFFLLCFYPLGSIAAAKLISFFESANFFLKKFLFSLSPSEIVSNCLRLLDLQVLKERVAKCGCKSNTYFLISKFICLFYLKKSNIFWIFFNSLIELILHFFNEHLP